MFLHSRADVRSPYRDGIWDREEIEAIYGVHHIYSQKRSKVRPSFPTGFHPPTHHAFQDEVEHQKKAEYVVDTVLKTMDKNQDGQVTPDEFEEAGFKGLPSFDDIGAEGHHYDVESGASFWKSYRRLSETLMMSSH